jgi:hypothetical protein
MELVFIFMAKTARSMPRITKRNARRTENFDVPARDPRRKADPRNISKRPIRKATHAAIRRENIEAMLQV